MLHAALSRHRQNIGFFAMLGLALAGLALMAKDGLINLPEYWSKEEYSHSYLIPLISIMIGWHRLTEKKPAFSPSWHGIWVLAICFIFLSFSYFASFEALLNYSFICGLVGLSLSFGGRAATFALAPAFLFLSFAAPLPHVIYGNLSIQMQLISSTLGVLGLKVLGVSVFQDGNIIDLGAIKLQVAEACNGLRYLFPLASFSFLVAFLLDDKMWKRVVLFLSAMPITIFMNALRIAIIGMTSNIWGLAAAEGFIHVFEGYAVFFACLALLSLVTWGLMRIKPSGRFRYDYLGLASGPLFSGKVASSPPAVTSVILCLALALLLHGGLIKKRGEVFPPPPDLSVFISGVTGWHAKTSALEPNVIETLSLTDYFIADYEKEHSPPVNFYVAYYKSQHVRANIHIPLGCILGSGWTVDQQEIVDVSLSDGTKVPLKRVLISRDDDRALSYYWLDQRGRVVNNSFINKWYLFWDALTLGRTDGALVRLATSVSRDETEAAADQRLQGFLSLSYPLIRRVLPRREEP